MLDATRSWLSRCAPTQAVCQRQSQKTRAARPRPTDPVPHSGVFGAGERTRTSDPRITNALLYQLSYSGAEGGYVKQTGRRGQCRLAREGQVSNSRHLTCLRLIRPAVPVPPRLPTSAGCAPSANRGSSRSPRAAGNFRPPACRARSGAA
jgi:hypothetical protein